MQKWIVAALSVGLLGSQVSYGDQTEIRNANVTIVVNQGQKSSPKKTAAKKAATLSHPKIVRVPSKKATSVAKKTPGKSKAVVAANQRATQKIPARTIPGQRVALANANAAHANAYSSYYALNEPTQSTLNTAVSPSVSTKLVPKAKEETPNPFEFKIRSNNAMNMNAVENYGSASQIDRTIQAWERINFTYYLDPKDKNIYFSLMPQLFHTWFADQDRPQSASNPGLTQSYAFFVGDTALQFEDKKIATFGSSGISFGTRQEFYAPTSQASQTAGQILSTRTAPYLTASVGKFDFKWTEELWYYFQQYETNAYLDASKGIAIPNVQYRMMSYGDITWNITTKLSIALESGVINESFYGDSYNGVQPGYTNYIEMNPEVDYEFNKNFSLGLGIWEMTDLSNPPTFNGQPVSSYIPFAVYNGMGAGAWAANQLYLQANVKF